VTRARAARAVLAFVLGAAAGVLLHYTLYRMMLPVRPFIYAVF
jgi:hypothetical protein